MCGYDETGAQCPADCKGSCGDGFCSMSETCKGAPMKRHLVEECFDDCGECDASATLAGLFFSISSQVMYVALCSNAGMARLTLRKSASMFLPLRSRALSGGMLSHRHRTYVST